MTLLTMHECRHTFAPLLIDTGAIRRRSREVRGHLRCVEQAALAVMAAVAFWL